MFIKIDGNCITFRSTPENYHKEKSGLKPNTVRRISLWSEMKEFEEFYEYYKVQLYIHPPEIKIINSITHEELPGRLRTSLNLKGCGLLAGSTRNK